MHVACYFIYYTSRLAFTFVGTFSVDFRWKRTVKLWKKQSCQSILNAINIRYLCSVIDNILKSDDLNSQLYAPIMSSIEKDKNSELKKCFSNRQTS